MPSPSQRAPWTSTYRLSSETRQQRILRAIHRLDHPGIKALGTSRDAEAMIVIECGSAAEEVRSRRVVMALDREAVRTETRRAAEAGPGEAAPGTAYLSGFVLPRRLLKLVPSERLRRLI